MRSRLLLYAEAWAAIDAEALAEFWAPEAFAFYKAEEAGHFFLSWNEVLRYWRTNDRLHAQVDLCFDIVSEIPLSDAVRSVITAMEWRIRFREDAVDAAGLPFRHRGKAMAGFNHVLSLWTDKGDVPRLTGWCEAPNSATLYLAELYTRLGEQQ
jgi:hypothetical protein